MKTEMQSLRDVLHADPAFRHEFLSAPSHETAAELVGQRGWSLPMDDIRTLREGFSLGKSELSDAELETISGGTGGVMKTRHDTAKNSIGNIR